MSRSRRTTLIGFGAAAVLFVLVVALSVVSVTVPGVCEGCHASRTTAPGAGDGTHAAVACLQCHAYGGVADRAELAAAVPLMLVRSAPEGVAQVSRKACLKCHAAVTEGITNVGGLRIDHTECAPTGSTCALCHDEVIHGDQGSGDLVWQRSMGMEECISCHDAQRGSQECDTCHDGKMQRARLTSGVWQITHGPEWRTKHGLGGTRMCTACHAGADCAECHGIELPHKAEFSRSHGTDAQANPASCEGCHSKDFCDDCHGIRMPHPKEFMPEQHADVVKARGEAQCLVCHARRDCVVCHDRHVHPGWADRSNETTRGAR